MRISTKIALLAGWLLISGIPSHSRAQVPTHRVRYADTLVHEAPSYVSPVVKELPKGREIQVLETRGEWMKLAGGWVHQGFLEPVEASTPVEPELERESGDCSAEVRAIQRRLEEECRERLAAQKQSRNDGSGGPAPAQAAEKAAEALQAEQARSQELAREVEALRRALTESKEQPEMEETLERARAQAFEEGRRRGLAEAAETRASSEESERERQEEARQEAYDAGLEAGRKESQEEQRRALEELELEWKNRLLEEADRINQEKEEELRLLREEEKARLKRYLEEIEAMRKRQSAEDLRRVEDHVGTMCEASLREQKLRSDRELADKLESQRKRLEREYASRLLKAASETEEAFEARLELMRNQEQESCRSSLEVVRKACDSQKSQREASPQPESRGPDAGQIRQQAQAACEQRIESLRGALRRECELELEAARDRAPPSPVKSEASPPSPAAQPGGKKEEGACSRRIQRALEKAESDWQRETARLVDRATAAERERCKKE